MRIWADLITVAETPTFMQQAESIWSDEEREGFVDFIARNPNAGDVIPQTGGVRKVRWQGQTRRHTGYLLLPRPGCTNLSANDLHEDGTREHFAGGQKSRSRVRRQNQAGTP